MEHSLIERDPFTSSAINGHKVKAVVHPGLCPPDHALRKVQLSHFEKEAVSPNPIIGTAEVEQGEGGALPGLTLKAVTDVLAELYELVFSAPTRSKTCLVVSQEIFTFQVNHQSVDNEAF